MRCRGFAAFLAVWCALHVPGCSRNTPEKASGEAKAPVAFFAVDGLEWSVLGPLIRSGKTPVMASLVERGSYGFLETMEPTYSPVIWTSIATGKTPEKHGITHFVYRTGPGENDYQFFTSGHRKAKAFWNIVSDYERSVACIGWWMTYPAEAVNGVMVSQTNTTGVLEHAESMLWKGSLLPGVEDQVYPPELTPEVMRDLAVADSTIDSVVTRIFGTYPTPTTEFTKMLWDQSMWAIRSDAVYERVAHDLLSSGRRFDVFSVYLSGPDVLGHRFWRYAHPEDFWNPPGEAERERFGRVIDDYYVHVDQVIGYLLTRLPDSTTVIIVSDHGMHSVNLDREFTVEEGPPPLYQLSGNHLDAPPGVFIAAGPRIRRMPWTGDLVLDRVRPIGRAVDVLPTLLALEGIPAGEDFDGRVMAEVLAPAFIESVPLRTVATHDDPAWEQARAARMREALDRTERLEQLRSLGYIN